MTQAFEYHTPSAEDTQPFLTLLAQCFITSPDREQGYFKTIGADQFRVVSRSGQLVGGLTFLPMAQWWGGRSVPMTGIASVGIAPEQRGTGAAIALMQQAIAELHDKGIALSVLYPAVQQLYRKAGYEQGGSYCSWELAVSMIESKRSLPVLPVAVDDPRIVSLYQQQAARTNGWLDRHPVVWQEIRHAESSDPLYAYLLSAEQPEGYLIFQQRRTKEGTILHIRDWVALTARAGQSLWGLLADHRSQIDRVRWQGGAIDPLMLLLPEQIAWLKSTKYWMLRVITVRPALEKRGYPVSVGAELHLEIQDELLPGNSGRVILTVTDGRGEVTAGGRGDLLLDSRGLAALYAGLYTPAQLQQMGFLQATPAALAIATQLFTTASPWMPDFF